MTAGRRVIRLYARRNADDVGAARWYPVGDYPARDRAKVELQAREANERLGWQKYRVIDD